MLVANRVVIKNLCYFEYQNATFKYMDILSGKIYRSKQHLFYNTSGKIHKTLNSWKDSQDMERFIGPVFSFG